MKKEAKSRNDCAPIAGGGMGVVHSCDDHAAGKERAKRQHWCGPGRDPQIGSRAGRGPGEVAHALAISQEGDPQKEKDHDAKVGTALRGWGVTCVDFVKPRNRKLRKRAKARNCSGE